MKKLKFRIQVKDKNLKRYITLNKVTVLDFSEVITFRTQLDFNLIENVARQIAEKYLAICKDGSDITISIFDTNEVAGTLIELATYYQNENKFIILK